VSSLDTREYRSIIDGQHKKEQSRSAMEAEDSRESELINIIIDRFYYASRYILYLDA
jgi:hypothetical protein